MAIQACFSVTYSLWSVHSWVWSSVFVSRYYSYFLIPWYNLSPVYHKSSRDAFLKILRSRHNFRPPWLCPPRQGIAGHCLWNKCLIYLFLLPIRNPGLTFNLFCTHIRCVLTFIKIDLASDNIFKLLVDQNILRHLNFSSLQPSICDRFEFFDFQIMDKIDDIPSKIITRLA